MAKTKAMEEEEEEEEESCRICLEGSGDHIRPIQNGNESESENDYEKDNKLISPCACAGTQAFVHFNCLRRWQNAVIATRPPGASQNAAFICSVCNEKFSVGPPRPTFTTRIWKVLTTHSCEIAGLFVVLVIWGYEPCHSLLEEFSKIMKESL